MRAIVQRVRRAAVMVGGEQVSAIGNGFLVLLGVTHTDGEQEAEVLARKIGSLRVFEDADGRMNLSLGETSGAVLAVSQFTLYADVRKGRRPGFTDAARPNQAEPLYRHFCRCLAAQGFVVGEGVFGAHMQIELVNDGPVTLILDSEQLSAA